MAKKIGDKMYVHVSALDTLPKELQVRVKQAKVALPDNWYFNMIKVSTKKNEVSFIYACGFDAFDEPVVNSSIKVVDGQASKIRHESNDNPTIYHGKHFFVKPNYPGFDVAAAKKRYQAWKTSGIPEVQDVSRIGRLRYWNDVVLPKLKEKGIL